MTFVSHIVACLLYSTGACLDVLPLLPSDVLNVDEREHLPASELQTLLAEWDSAASKGICETRRRMLPKVSVLRLDEPCCSPYWLVRYNNPEVLERVINLFLGHYQALLRLRMLSIEQADRADYPPERLELSKANHAWYESLLKKSVQEHGFRYTDSDINEIALWEKSDDEGNESQQLASLAQSTFSNTIYDAVWGSTLVGPLQEVYLATVRADKTVDLLINTTLGIRMGLRLQAGQDMLCRKDNGVGIFVSDAFRILAAIARRQPDVIAAREKEVMEFVERHGKHYWASERYSEIRDYWTRLYALQVLEATGNSAYLSVVNHLVTNAPSKERAERSLRAIRCDLSCPEILERAAEVTASLRKSGL